MNTYCRYQSYRALLSFLMHILMQAGWPAGWPVLWLADCFSGSLAGWHCIALHCIALHYITLHCIALHYITLHYITLCHTNKQLQYHAYFTSQACVAQRSTRLDSLNPALLWHFRKITTTTNSYTTHKLHNKLQIVNHLSLYMYMYIYIYMYIHTYTYTPTRLHTYAYIHI